MKGIRIGKLEIDQLIIRGGQIERKKSKSKYVDNAVQSLVRMERKVGIFGQVHETSRTRGGNKGDTA